MKKITVASAVICDTTKDRQRIFAAQKGYGQFQGLWEFPGGKIEKGETPEQALAREIKEELNSEISVGDLIDIIEYDYPDFHLTMYCFWAYVISGDLALKEHSAARWLTKETIDSVEWLPANQGLIQKIKQVMQENENRV